MKYTSAFDIIGPAMVGPSSSHTAGSLRLGRIVRCLLGGVDPVKLEVIFYGSFATTYQGHGSDVAVVAGCLGYDTHDARIADALEIAEKLGIEVVLDTSNHPVDHPNTLKIRLTDGAGKTAEMMGCSIGGGRVEVVRLNGFSLRYTGAPGLGVLHEDRYGMIEKVTGVLSRHQINISRMEVGRKRKRDEAFMVIEIDGELDAAWLEEIKQIQGVMGVIPLHS